MNLITVVGARPQFVKAAPVSAALAGAGVREQLLHTGQHYDENLSEVFFKELGIAPPAYRLQAGSGLHGAQTGRMLEQIENVLIEQQPDWVLVYGDTNSTLAGALAAAKLHIPVAHVEAGLRSFNRRMPEEINRVLTDHASRLLFAPTSAAVKNLRDEGVAESDIVLCGDVMFDVALHFSERSRQHSKIVSELGLREKVYCLATVHRAENTDHAARLAAILGGLELVARDRTVVLPLHPRTRKMLGDERLAQLKAAGICVIGPVGYLDMVALERNACVIATDSGGVQKEAFFYQVPCVTLRDETEWVELVDLGWNRVVAPSSAATVHEAITAACNSRGRDARPYGDGKAAGLIAQRLAAL